MFTNEEFKGPTHFSHQISFQDGDQSANSNFNESFLEPEKLIGRNTISNQNS